MRIDPDTKDALLFMTGLLGLIAQLVLSSIGVSPSYPLIGAFLIMCTIAVAPNVASLLASMFGYQKAVPHPDDHRDDTTLDDD